MKKLMISMALLSYGAFANEQLCGIDYASMNLVEDESVINTDSSHLSKAIEKVELLCDKQSIATQKDRALVEGYFDGYAAGYDNENQESVEMSSLIQVCRYTLNNLKTIQFDCSAEIALEVESALYHTQRFCNIAENQNGYLAGYLDAQD